MKKVLALVMALALTVGLFALAGCGEKKEPEKKTLTMATNAAFPPYEFVDGDKIVGIDAEVAQLIADKLGMKLEIIDVEFNSVIPGVQTGKFDMGMAGLTVNAERLKKVSFSDSYAKGIQAVIVADGSTINKVEDLKNKKIGVQDSTTGDIYASETYGEKNVIKMANGGVAVEALKKGKIDAVIIDNEPAKSFVAQNEGLHILEEEFANEDYAICFAKKNSELKDKVNNALKELIADGSVKKIVEKYIPAE